MTFSKLNNTARMGKMKRMQYYAVYLTREAVDD